MGLRTSFNLPQMIGIHMDIEYMNSQYPLSPQDQKKMRIVGAHHLNPQLPLWNTSDN